MIGGGVMYVVVTAQRGRLDGGCGVVDDGLMEAMSVWLADEDGEFVAVVRV